MTIICSQLRLPGVLNLFFRCCVFYCCVTKHLVYKITYRVTAITSEASSIVCSLLTVQPPKQLSLSFALPPLTLSSFAS